MKSLIVLAALVLSSQVFAQASGQGKAVNAVLPRSAQSFDATKKGMKKDEAPCDTKEDVLKKLEEEKKAQAAAGKGLSLQGKTDAGCTIK